MQQLRDIIAKTLEAPHSTDGGSRSAAARIVTPDLWKALRDALKAEIKEELKMELFIELNELRAELLPAAAQPSAPTLNSFSTASKSTFGSFCGAASLPQHDDDDSIPAALANNPLFASINAKVERAKGGRSNAADVDAYANARPDRLSATTWADLKSRLTALDVAIDDGDEDDRWDKLATMQQEQLSTYL